MTTEPKIIRNKLGLLRLAERLGNVSQACKVIGYSRCGTIPPIEKPKMANWPAS